MLLFRLPAEFHPVSANLFYMYETTNFDIWNGNQQQRQHGDAGPGLPDGLFSKQKSNFL
jgi:hypothetical protein